MGNSGFRTLVQLASDGLSTVMRRTIDRFRDAQALSLRAGAMDRILPTI
jgi:hypothetical protein